MTGEELTGQPGRSRCLREPRRRNRGGDRSRTIAGRGAAGAGARVVPHRLRRPRDAAAREPDRRRSSASNGVVAVQTDKLAQPLTDATPEFLGATDVWPVARRHEHRPARASSSASSTPASGRSTRRSPTPASATRAARSPASSATARSPAGRSVRVQRQADRRLRLHRTRTSTFIGAEPGRVLQQRDGRVLGARRRRPRDAHRLDRGGQPGRLGAALRHRARADQRHRPGRARHRLPRLPRPGLLPVRLGGGDRAGDPRRRRRDQLLDRRRREPVHRPGRARLPRRLRGGHHASTRRPATPARARRRRTTAARG